MKRWWLILIVLNVCWAGVGDAWQLRWANYLAKRGEYVQALERYNKLSGRPQLIFNKALVKSWSGEAEDANKYYELFAQDARLSNKERAKAYLNLGNETFKTMDFKQAAEYYKKGLLLDHKNKRLKYNLELANNVKLSQKVQKKQQQGSGKDKKDDKNKQKQDKQNQQSKQNAERMLDAFKDQEQKDLEQIMKNREQKQNVEKDW